mmetsp:Transcript_6909/g.7575  ORF Transcript_6909/g.7575 Transcript_6909/m.7575 type:complete len:315 (-) Transcript_6909:156-1100(-)
MAQIAQKDLINGFLLYNTIQDRCRGIAPRCIPSTPAILNYETNVRKAVRGATESTRAATGVCDGCGSYTKLWCSPQWAVNMKHKNLIVEPPKELCKQCKELLNTADFINKSMRNDKSKIDATLDHFARTNGISENSREEFIRSVQTQYNAAYALRVFLVDFIDDFSIVSREGVINPAVESLEYVKPNPTLEKDTTAPTPILNRKKSKRNSSSSKAKKSNENNQKNNAQKMKKQGGVTKQPRKLNEAQTTTKTKKKSNTKQRVSSTATTPPSKRKISKKRKKSTDSGRKQSKRAKKVRVQDRDDMQAVAAFLNGS